MNVWDFLWTIIEMAFVSGLVAICVFMIWGGMLALIYGSIMFTLHLIERFK